MILLSFMMTAFVVAEPESRPMVSPSCRSRASRARRRAIVTSASIRVSSVPEVVRSVNEYVTTGRRDGSWMYRRSSFRTMAASAQRKQVAMKTASASTRPSTSALARAIISLRSAEWTSRPNPFPAERTSVRVTSG